MITYEYLLSFPVTVLMRHVGQVFFNDDWAGLSYSTFSLFKIPFQVLLVTAFSHQSSQIIICTTSFRNGQFWVVSLYPTLLCVETGTRLARPRVRFIPVQLPLLAECLQPWAVPVSRSISTHTTEKVCGVGPAAERNIQEPSLSLPVLPPAPR